MFASMRCWLDKKKSVGILIWIFKRNQALWWASSKRSWRNCDRSLNHLNAYNLKTMIVHGVWKLFFNTNQQEKVFIYFDKKIPFQNRLKTWKAQHWKTIFSTLTVQKFSISCREKKEFHTFFTADHSHGQFYYPICPISLSVTQYPSDIHKTFPPLSLQAKNRNICWN